MVRSIQVAGLVLGAYFIGTTSGLAYQLQTFDGNGLLRGASVDSIECLHAQKNGLFLGIEKVDVTDGGYTLHTYSLDKNSLFRSSIKFVDNDRFNLRHVVCMKYREIERFRQ